MWFKKRAYSRASKGGVVMGALRVNNVNYC